MTELIRVEFKPPGTNEWKKLLDHPRDAEMAGTMASHPPGASRQIFVFGWQGDEGPCVWRSDFGMDVEDPPAPGEILGGREVLTTGLTKIADLDDGPCEISVWSPVWEGKELELRVTAL